MFKKNTSNFYDEPFIENNDIEKNKISELFTLIKNFNKDELQQYLINNDININFSDELGRNLIFHCVHIDDDSKIEYTRLNIIKFLIDKGVNPDEADKFNVTPLHVACKKQMTNIIFYLLENDCDLYYKDNSGRSPLHYLVESKILPCIKKKMPTKLVKPKDTISYTKISIKKRIKKKLWRIIKSKKIDNYDDDCNDNKLILRLEKLFFYYDKDFDYHRKLTNYDKTYNNIDYFEDLYLSVKPNYDSVDNKSKMIPIDNIDFLNENVHDRSKYEQFRNNIIERNNLYLQDIRNSINQTVFSFDQFKSKEIYKDIFNQYLDLLDNNIELHSNFNIDSTDSIVYIEQNKQYPIDFNQVDNPEHFDNSFYLKKDNFFYKCKFFITNETNQYLTQNLFKPNLSYYNDSDQNSLSYLGDQTRQNKIFNMIKNKINKPILIDKDNITDNVYNPVDKVTTTDINYENIIKLILQQLIIRQGDKYIKEEIFKKDLPSELPSELSKLIKYIKINQSESSSIDIDINTPGLLLSLFMNIKKEQSYHDFEDFPKRENFYLSNIKLGEQDIKFINTIVKNGDDVDDDGSNIKKFDRDEFIKYLKNKENYPFNFRMDGTRAIGDIINNQNLYVITTMR